MREQTVFTRSELKQDYRKASKSLDKAMDSLIDASVTAHGKHEKKIDSFIWKVQKLQFEIDDKLKRLKAYS